MTRAPSTTHSRTTVPAMRFVFGLGALLVFVIGADLDVFSSRTEALFAWTVVSPLTAAFLGAFYWTACILAALSYRQTVWAEARVGLLGVFVFVGLTLVLSVLHLDQLHLHTRIFPMLVTYAWLMVYAFDPLLIIGAWISQRRAAGEDAPRRARLPRWYQLLLFLHAAAFLSAGVMLFGFPSLAMRTWPWQIDTLDARAMGAWLIGLALVVGQAGWEDAWERVSIAVRSAAVLGLLLLVFLGRFHSSLGRNWSTAALVVAVVSVFLVGAYGTLAASHATAD